MMEMFPTHDVQLNGGIEKEGFGFMMLRDE